MKLSGSSKLLYWKKLIFILTAGWIIIFAYRTLLVPIYPVISQYFGGVTNAQLGYISSCYFLGYVCMQIPSGLLVDKIGRKQILIPSFLIFAVGGAIVASSSSLLMVYIGSLIAGIGCGTFYGVAYSFTAKYVPATQKSLATAIVNSGIAMGSSIGLISSSFLVGRGILHWQYLIVILIIFILIMVFVFKRFIMPEEKLINNKQDNQSSSSPLSMNTANISLWRSLSRPPMIAAYILYFSTLYTYYLIDTWLPNFLEVEKGVAATSVGFMSSLAFFSAIPGALFFSYIADVFFKKKIQIIITLEILAMLCLFVAVYSSNTNIVTISIIAYGFFGKLVVEPIIIAWFGQFVSLKRLATTYGVFNFFGMSSAVIVPSLTGYISDIMHSKSYAFYLGITITLTGTLAFYIITKLTHNVKNNATS